MNKLRLSYSLLNMWKQGKIDDAVVYYFKLGTKTNKYLEKGKAFDEYVEEYVNKNNKFPEELKHILLKNPKTQLKVEAEYSDKFDLVGVYDVYDDPILYEVKTGDSKDSADYAIDYQVSLYLLLAKLKKIPVKEARILHFNGKFDQSLVWNNESEIERARNYIDTIAPDIYDYFVKNNLLNKKREEGNYAI